VLPALAFSATVLSRINIVQNGPGRASDCPPPKLGVTLWVKRVTTLAYSPDQLLEMTLRMSAKPARLAEAIAA
jgi:hypothetical protein